MAAEDDEDQHWNLDRVTIWNEVTDRYAPESQSTYNLSC